MCLPVHRELHCYELRRISGFLHTGVPHWFKNLWHLVHGDGPPARPHESTPVVAITGGLVDIKNTRRQTKTRKPETMRSLCEKRHVYLPPRVRDGRASVAERHDARRGVTAEA